MRDIRQKADLASEPLPDSSSSALDPESVRARLHGARCVYNALSDIKPEVENVIKMGRTIVLSEDEVVEDRRELTEKIDSLKEEFNEIGGQVKCFFFRKSPLIGKHMWKCSDGQEQCIILFLMMMNDDFFSDNGDQKGTGEGAEILRGAQRCKGGSPTVAFRD